MAAFLASLAHDDLAAATLRGYRYDLRHFLAWHSTVQDKPFVIKGLAEHELIAYRQHMVAGGRRPATVNRRLANANASDRLAGALTQLGRLMKTIHILRYIQEAPLRDAIQL